MKRLCVFCGSSTGLGDLYRSCAEEMGRAMADRNIEVVYGGGRVGLMGALADAALAVGGRVIGVIPSFLDSREIAHGEVSDLHVVDSMHERKALMSELADGFVALPGGLGTLEELAEILTWDQLGLQTKPIGLLNAGGYYDHLLSFLNHQVEQGFLPSAHRVRLLDDPTVEGLLEQVLADDRSRTGPAEKWLDRT